MLVTEGEMTLIQQVEGKEHHVTLREGEYAINPPGVWHTADIDGEAEALFTTPRHGKPQTLKRAGQLALG